MFIVYAFPEEHQPTIANAVRGHLAPPVLKRAVLLKLTLDWGIGLIDHRLLARADDAIGQHECAVVPTDAGRAPHAFLWLRRLDVVRNLCLRDLRHADFHTHFEQGFAKLCAVARKKASGRGPPLLYAVWIGKFEEVAPLAIHFVARLRDHVDARTHAMRWQRLSLIVEAVIPDGILVDLEARLAIGRTGRCGPLGGIGLSRWRFFLARALRAAHGQRSEHGGRHSLDVQVRGQIVAIRSSGRTLVSEPEHCDDTASRTDRRACFCHAGITFRPVIVVGTQDDSSVGILRPHRNGHAMEVRCVECDSGRKPRRGLDRSAGRIPAPYRSRHRRSKRSSQIYAHRASPELAGCIPCWNDECTVASYFVDCQIAVIDPQTTDADALAHKVGMIERCGIRG